MPNKNPKTKPQVAGAVVYRDGRVLLLQRSSTEASYPNLWELPSGGLKSRESLEAALAREVAEETGLSVKPVKMIGSFEYTLADGSVREQTNWLVTVVGAAEVKLSAEHQQFAWININEIEKYHLSPEVEKIVEAAFLASEQLGL
ncbi:NUDIX domain-containing protein [Candidatus Falkowbacteria bacterium]|nr:NUDIX domain-containing protein [Candidatus Falkowbacteria bacterium]